MSQVSRRQKILITGATGFIGGALSRTLVANGYTVTRVLRENGNSDVGQAQGDSPVVTIGRFDPYTDWQAAVAGQDVVIHLAARAHYGVKNSSLTDLRTVNVHATAQLARHARAAGVRHFVFMSSIGVLGQSSEHPLTEIDSPAPTDPYAHSKYEAEMALWAITAASDMALTVIRPPLVHGPAAPGNFGRLLAWAQTNRPLPLGAVTANQRSLVGQGNLVGFIQRVVEHPLAADQTLHVADEGAISTTRLLRVLAEAADRQPLLLPVAPRLLEIGARLLGRGDTARRLLGSLTVDTHKARERLDWRPPTELEQGLRSAVRDQILVHAGTYNRA
jgi:nucleoside-diphosphate-sugar epimerase